MAFRSPEILDPRVQGLGHGCPHSVHRPDPSPPNTGLGFQGLGFRVWGLGFRVESHVFPSFKQHGA